MMMNDSKQKTHRLPSEWEGDRAVIVAWPHANTDWNYMLPQVEECYDSLVRAICRHAVAVIIAPETKPLRQRFKDIDKSRILYFDVATNDTWTRDYGVICTEMPDGSVILNDFGFNAWGGKFESSLDNAVTRKMFDAGLIKGEYRDLTDFILEGGSIESDGNGTILTTSSCLLTDTRNPRFSKSEIEEKLHDTLCAKKVLWLDRGEMIGDDTDGHIDTIARIAPFNTILYNGTGWGTEPTEQSHALEGVMDQLRTFTNADGEAFSLIELPLPDPIMDEDDGHQLPATYANFLIVNDAILMPTYGQPGNDFRAEMALKVAFPDHTIERVDCRALIRQHGSLHCATMQIPQSILPI